MNFHREWRTKHFVWCLSGKQYEKLLFTVHIHVDAYSRIIIKFTNNELWCNRNLLFDVYCAQLLGKQMLETVCIFVLNYWQPNDHRKNNRKKMSVLVSIRYRCRFSPLTWSMLSIQLLLLGSVIWYCCCCFVSFCQFSFRYIENDIL